MIVSNNHYPSVLLVEQDPNGPPAVPTPGTNEHRLFIGDDGILYTIDENDTVTPVQGGSSVDAVDVTYTPADGDDWGTDPDDASEALDQLALRTTVVEILEADAIHASIAGEIAAVTEKTSPHEDDVLLIEDSEDTNEKKRVKLGNLPGGGGGGQSLFTFSDISALSFTAVNGGGTFTPTTFGNVDGFVLSTPSESFSTRGREVDAPTAPYSITIGMIPTLNGDGSGVNENPFAGLFWRESGSDKFAAFALLLVDGGFNPPQLASYKFTNATTFSAGYATYEPKLIPYNGGLIWLRIEDNNTNRICSYSVDGVTFIEFHSVTRLDFLTPDKVGIFINSNTNGRTSYAAFVSWLEA
jgi:hypothetical protein